MILFDRGTLSITQIEGEKTNKIDEFQPAYHACFVQAMVEEESREQEGWEGEISV